jgi:hypothetical protein
MFWYKHIQKHREECIDSRLSTTLKTFLGSMDDSGLAFRKWGRWVNREPMIALVYYIYSLPTTLAAFAICHFGFYEVLTDWWALGFQNPNQRNARGSPLLALAAASGSAGIVKHLMDNGAVINAQDREHRSALSAAAFSGNDVIVQLLLDHGTDVNAQGGEWGTALRVAAAHGRENIVRLLLDHGTDVNAQGDLFGSALSAAAFNGIDVIVRLLLDYGADINARGGKFGSALTIAKSRGHVGLVELLRKKGGVPHLRAHR